MLTREDLIDRLLAREGGYSADPADSGGRTRWGITEATARAAGYQGPMRDLPRLVARRIYAERYWHPLRLDEILLLAPQLAEELFDSAVNIGPGTVSRWLQRALNALSPPPDISVDGQIGPQTLTALRAYLNRRAPHGEVVLLRALNGLQAALYIDLAERRPKDERFLYGWLLHRVS